ncbi:MAG: hypothetical protein IT210_07690 [Armatimonadetes bacterium]|nr:hypothetical protein [Armatimonadota bacterium]
MGQLKQPAGIYELWGIIKRRWYLVAMIMLAAIGGSVAITYLPPPLYKASVKLLFPTASFNSGLSGLLSSMGLSAGGSGASLDMYEEILKSYSVVRGVANRTGLGISAVKDIHIIKKNDANILEIEAKGKTADEAVWIANQYVQGLKKREAELQLLSVHPEVSFVREKVARSQRALAEAEERLLRFQERNNIIAPLGASAPSLGIPMPGSSAKAGLNITLPTAASSGASTYDDQLRMTNLQIQEKRAQIDIMKKKLFSIASKAMDLSADLPIAQEERKKLRQREYDLAAARIQYGEQHPTVVSLKKEIDILIDEIKQEVARSKEAANYGYTAELISAETELAALNERRTVLTQLMQKLPPQMLEMNRLARELQIQQALYQMFRAQYEQLAVEEARDPNRWSVLDYAQPPEKPCNRRILMNTALALILGSFFAGVMVFWLENLRASRTA